MYNQYNIAWDLITQKDKSFVINYFVFIGQVNMLSVTDVTFYKEKEKRDRDVKKQDEKNKCFEGWLMNSQQRSFLTSIFEERE